MTNAGLGAAIRNVRQQQKMHQDHLAGVTGIDASVVSRIERGERPCRVAELVLLAAGLNISADELVRRAVQQQRSADNAGSDE
ncbi:helix-turn-helix domain-containing protein [Mycolicibacterium aubagnense]|nr:helix-turn-helix transcriptional regulator [Mycolicibacterium aubagnense]TLH49016.1 XRE family transcriptional regulator [Mycolicibacterium aubagnense]